MMTAMPRVTSDLKVWTEDKILIVQLNRPDQLNAMTDAMERDICAVFDWYETNPALWVAIITGTGRAFCAGADLKTWLKSATEDAPDVHPKKILANRHGFGSLATRKSKKPLIGALNGHTFGGGAEIAFNCDIVIGAHGAKVGFPEVLRGVVASVGGIPNAFNRSPLFMPYLLTGEPIPASLLERFLFTSIVPADQVLSEALSWARRICKGSPEAVWVTKEQIAMIKEGMGISEVVKASIRGEEGSRMYGGMNVKEGLRAFKERRDPVWTDPPPVKSRL